MMLTIVYNLTIGVYKLYTSCGYFKQSYLTLNSKYKCSGDTRVYIIVNKSVYNKVLYLKWIK